MNAIAKDWLNRMADAVPRKIRVLQKIRHVAEVAEIDARRCGDTTEMIRLNRVRDRAARMIDEEIRRLRL